MGSNQKKFLSTLVIVTLIATMFIDVSTPSFIFESFIIKGNAGANENSAWHNSTYLNVTIESKRPRILWYDFQKCTDPNFDGYNTTSVNNNSKWVSKRNNMTEVDNSTWYRFIINISSDQGWDNIEYINISGWHDEGNDSDVDGRENATGGYNRSGNQGGNRNFFMYYINTSDTSNTSYFNLTYPTNKTEITIGCFSENVVTDVLGISGQTETHNISFVFKPGYQFRYGSGPGESSDWTNDTVSCTDGVSSGDGYSAVTRCWESFDNPWSWNFNITIENSGENWGSSDDSDGIDRYKSWVRDEFGVYSYTEIVSAENVDIYGAPGERHSTNGSSWYNANFNGGTSTNVSVRTRSNGNYTLTVNVSDLKHVADNSQTLDNSTIFVRGGNRTNSINFDDSGQSVIYLYGFGSGNGTLGSITSWQTHEVNGTWKDTGEAADDGRTALYPNFYGSGTYNGKNSASHYIEFACEIPSGTLPGKYSTHVYYHLRTQTHN
ncbi:MAG: hypothetical protein DRN27_07570 [Thermoplasmata archaeon]|nr:MAG: hypothetical protein DRN27_07570 [Thermoplasmata archaeon]